MASQQKDEVVLLCVDMFVPQILDFSLLIYEVINEDGLH